jgi:hypothetical protein
MLRKQEQANTKTSRRREVIKIRNEINEKETKEKKKQELMKEKFGFLKKYKRSIDPRQT